MPELNLPVPVASVSTVWSFNPGHIFSIGETDYEFLSSDLALMRLRSVATGIEHLLPQIDPMP